MKKELKTLKDMKIYPIGNIMKEWMDDVVSIYELKAEAVKWLDKERTLRMNGNDFILVFFNLTEEDIEGGNDE